MTMSIRLFLALFAFATVALTGVQAQDTYKTGSHLLEQISAGETIPVIVRLNVSYQPEAALRSDIAVEEQRELISSAQDELVLQLDSQSAFGIKLFETVPYVALEVTESGLEHLLASPNVVAVHEDYLVAPQLPESTDIIGAPFAWLFGNTGAGQAVAVLDTGTDIAHSFFGGRIVAEACYSTGGTSLCQNAQTQQTGPGSSMPRVSICGLNRCDHGSHVAGIAMGSDGSFSGVAPEADLIGVIVFSLRGTPQECNGSPPCVRAATSDIMLGLEFVYAERDNFDIAAVNLSLGGGEWTNYCDSEPIFDPIQNLRDAGIATVIASGNNGFAGSISYPACTSNSISVGSTNDGSNGTVADEVSGFSNAAWILDMLAPGAVILSSVIGGGFSNSGGTSMAAPHVAGAWAVMKQAVPEASVDNVLQAILDTGEPILDTRNGLTFPRLQLDAAVDVLADYISTETIAIGSSFSVESVYPNPFRNQTTVRLIAPEPGVLDISVFDITGRRVAVLAADDISAGIHEYKWSAEGFSSGIYLVRAQQGASVATQRVTVIR